MPYNCSKHLVFDSVSFTGAFQLWHLPWYSTFCPSICLLLGFANCECTGKSYASLPARFVRNALLDLDRVIPCVFDMASTCFNILGKTREWYTSHIMEHQRLHSPWPPPLWQGQTFTTSLQKDNDSYYYYYQNKAKWKRFGKHVADYWWIRLSAAVANVPQLHWWRCLLQ